MATLVRDATFGFAAASIVAMIVLLLRRLVLSRLARLRLARETQLRGLVLAVISGEADLDERPPLTARDTRVFVEMLARYIRQLTGEDRGRITSVFEKRGDVEREIGALRGLRSSTRLRAALTLGDMGSETAIEPLVHALREDADREVRAAAARSLGRLGAAAAAPALVEGLAHVTVPRATAGKALLSIGAEAVPGLRELLGDDDEGIRAFTVELIGQLGDAGDGDRIVPLLADASPAVRRRAAEALGRLGAKSATATLRAGLGDPSPRVRAAVARTLAAIGDVDSVPALLAQAKGDDFEPAHEAAIAVARLQPTALPAPADPEANAHLVEAVDLVRFGVLTGST